MKDLQNYIGVGESARLRAILDAYRATRVALFHGTHSYTASGARSLVEAQLQGIEKTDSFYCPENPDWDHLQQNLAVAQSASPQAVVAIGGGSVIDMAKLVRYYLGNPAIPLIALPTTAGTGAEVTHFAVLYKDGIKQSIENELVRPDVALVDSRFTYLNSPSLTATTGFDALAQAVESFWANNGTDESRGYALKAIKLLYHQLPDAYNHPTPALRQALSEGAYWAGRAIDRSKTTAPHAYSYAFTARCGYPHGHAVALTFPYFAHLMAQQSRSVSDLFVDQLGMNPHQILPAWQQYVKTIGLVFKGTNGYDLNELLAQVNRNRLSNFPAKVDTTDLLNYMQSLI